MQKTVLPQRRFFSVPDLLVILLLATVIYCVISIGELWRAEFKPAIDIDLSIWALPRYTMLSAARGTVAYLVSLLFTLVVGYAAAKSRPAERVIIPTLDILQSIPVLGFLPGLVLGLIALFPHTNFGLELAAILTIFSSQVWNMAFAYYSSLKSIPSEFNEAAQVMGLNWRQRLLKLELPFSAVNLAWNSLMSMAGGWFFLNVCESFRLGEREFRLPGIGSYMAAAIAANNIHAMWCAVVAMILLIVFMDFLIWRPILAWVRRFRVEEILGTEVTEPLMRIALRESRILRWLRVEFRRRIWRRKHKSAAPLASPMPALEAAVRTPTELLRKRWMQIASHRRFPLVARVIQAALSVALATLIVWGGWKLLGVLWAVPFTQWALISRNTLWTTLRVLFAIALSSLWAVPMGIWIGVSPRRTRIAQPIIQVMASFPMPMLYPLALAIFIALRIPFDVSAMLLMMLGVQWYVLFNVLAGALRIPQELLYSLELMQASRWERWSTLYIPSVFPALVTGWVTGAGGAWNASIVAEVVGYRGGILKAAGLGAMIQMATDAGDFKMLAACLAVLVAVVIVLNRTVWARLYGLAQTRFRLD